MKMLLPVEPFGSLVRAGSAGHTKFIADGRFRIVMSLDELAKAELGELGKRWA
jgi:hypothetical protein